MLGLIIFRAIDLICSYIYHSRGWYYFIKGDSKLLYEDIDWKNLNKYQSTLCLPDEVWLDCDVVNEYFGCNSSLYQVSNYGRCRHTGKTRYGTSFKYPPKVFRITDNGNGYKKIALNFQGKIKNFYMHRLVASTFLENPENLPQVNHKKTGLGKFDNRVEHLEWSSESDNIRDAHKNGLMDNRTKVNTQTEQKPDTFVAEMYKRYLVTGKVGETAREFGVSRTTLSSIINKRSRRSVTDPIDLEFKI